MAHESLSRTEAIQYYKAAVAALPAPPPQNQTITGELARWSEQALWRTAAITAAERKPYSDVLEILRLYVNYSARWPATFRPRHRSTLLRLHLHILSLNPPPSPTSQRPGRLAWLHEARTIVAELRAVLTGSTKFPASGTRNAAVESFADGCVRLWEASGSPGDQADWVIDVCFSPAWSS
jgi:hypothetical protein